MPLYEVVFGQPSNPMDLNQVIDILQRKAGQQESGTYYLNGWSGAAGDTIGQHMQSLSRNTTPVSVSVDTALQSPVFCNSPITEFLQASGFHIRTTTTQATGSAYEGGNYTIQY